MRSTKDGMVIRLIPGMSMTVYANSKVASVTVGEITNEYETLSEALIAWRRGRP